ncbi:hypothetical protein PIB30_058189 [Stylosanthes scabra]|uniref:Uncharacterized protein n=1 Tax=Stylosanthes scabra TaxID=79078 RepID=A0ABU6WI79_9FABA|nr:hypothetical protein [Stylosanthes scabra]
MNTVTMGSSLSPNRYEPDQALINIREQHANFSEVQRQLKEWTKNSSARECYSVWAHQQANPNLVEIDAANLFTIRNNPTSASDQGNRRDKSIIEFDPEIEKTLKRNRSRVKAQRNLQFEQEEVNSEEGTSENSFEEECIEEEIQDNMADNQ